MSEMHLTRDLLTAVVEGRVPVHVVVEIAYRHLLALCPTCREAVRASRQRRSAPEDYSQAFAQARARLGREAARLARQHDLAEEWYTELAALPPEECIQRIEGARTRFRGRVFAQRLIAASKDALPGNPEESYHWAFGAETVLYHSGIGREEFPLLAQAIALAANAQRVLGDLAGADRLMAAARTVVERWGVTDPLARAEVSCLEGSLRRDQRRFGEAEELLRRAAVLYRAIGDEQRQVRTLLKLATVYTDQGMAEEAAEATFSALERIDAETDPGLYLGARYNLALNLHDAGRHQEARDILALEEPLLHEHADRWLKVRVQWLGAKIGMHLGEERVERRLLEVRDAFATRPLDQAHANLDLALLYLQNGRTGEVKRLAADVVACFQRQAVHREALAAALLFKEAADAEQVTAALLAKLARYLEEAKVNPRLRREEPS